MHNGTYAFSRVYSVLFSYSISGGWILEVSFKASLQRYIPFGTDFLTQ
jgi:hypothetical protein